MIELGHNVPPDQVGTLTDNYEELLQRQKELLEAANRAPKTCDSDATARLMVDFVGQMATAIKTAQAAHKVEKAPFLQAGRVVDGFFNQIIDPLDTFKKAFELLIGGYQRRKAEAVRLAAQAEAERLAALAETVEEFEAAIDQEAIANARPLEQSRLHGDQSTGSLLTSYEYEIVDSSKIPDRFWIVSEAAIRQHIMAGAKDGAPEPVPGLRFIPVHKARIRA